MEGVTPILRVADMAASLDHYVRGLGFTQLWASPYFASVVRGKCHLFLSYGDQGHLGSWVWIGVEDAQAQDVKTPRPSMAPVEQNVFCNPLETEA